MKKYLLTASLLAGLSMISAPAMAQASGYVGVAAGNFEVDLGPVSVDDNTIALDGSVAFPTGNGFLLQFDGGYTTFDESDTDGLFATAHFGLRNDQYAFGGYVGLTDNDSDNGVFGGGEYVMYMPQLSLSAGVGFGTFDDTDTDLVGFAGEGRYFVNDNLRFDGRLGWASADTSGSEGDGVSYGIGGEWKPDTLPLSFFASWDAADIEDAGFDVSWVQLGVRFNFGNGTLKARDRSGPAFKPFSGFTDGRLF
jgi:hypothetical protein